MPFPIDPNAPGGPRRSEYLRSCFAAAGASPRPEIAVAPMHAARVARGSTAAASYVPVHAPPQTELVRASSGVEPWTAGGWREREKRAAAAARAAFPETRSLA
jgi:hypothetical protein